MRRVLFTGFATDNYQARVNGLSLGLDGWVYGANGLLGGKIRDPKKPDKIIDIGGRDFRMKPDSGEFEPASGLTQQGRVRDDWGNWFGGDNSNLLRHFPLPDHYLRRNPHVAGPPPYVDVLRGGDADPNKLFPVSRILSRFNDFGSAGRVTSACSPLIYRDELLGNEFRGNAFVCEPVHNLVTRRVLEPKGTTFVGKRAADEQASEFLASTDSWFRPVQVRTGPDGALWVVDMYRFVIEHPRWIPPARLAELDVRAGADCGRIYRIYPEKSPPRAVPRLDKLERRELVQQLESPNGHIRDLAMQLIIERTDNQGSCIEELEWLVSRSHVSYVRLQALCTIGGMDAVTKDVLSNHALGAGLLAEDAAILRQGIRLSELWFARGDPSDDNPLWNALIELANNPNAQVRMQLACSLGEIKGKAGTRTLAALLKDAGTDRYVTAAVLTSIRKDNAEDVLLHLTGNENISLEAFQQFIRCVVALNKDRPQRVIAAFWSMITGAQPLRSHPTSREFAMTETFLDALDRNGIELATIYGGRPESDVSRQIGNLFAFARQTAISSKGKESDRVLAIPLLGRGPDNQKEDREKLADLLSHRNSPLIQLAALEALARLHDRSIPPLLLKDWPSRTPAVRGRVFDLFVARPEWTKHLLDAIEQKSVLPTEIGLVRSQRLLTHPDAAIRARATKAPERGHRPQPAEARRVVPASPEARRCGAWARHLRKDLLRVPQARGHRARRRAGPCGGYRSLYRGAAHRHPRSEPGR